LMIIAVACPTFWHSLVIQSLPSLFSWNSFMLILNFESSITPFIGLKNSYIRVILCKTRRCFMTIDFQLCFRTRH
jgi:hypothetical protein